MAQNRLTTHEEDFTKEDQASINNFSRLNMHNQDRSQQLYKKKELVSQLEDAITELDMQDDDQVVRMKFGDCFFHITTSDAKANLESQVQKLKNEAKSLDTEMHDISKKMQKLKAVLYAKFGNTINLEEE